MGIFGSGIRLRDVVAGAAKSIDDQLKDDIKRTKTFADDIAQYHIKRRQEKQEKLELDKEEVEDILEQFAGFVDESQLAEGVNKYDYAAQLMASAGGNTEVAKEYLKDLRESAKVGIDVKNLLPYVHAQTGGRNMADYVNKFVKRPTDVINISDDMTSGVGLYKLFKPRVGEDIKKQVELALPSKEPTPTFDVKAVDIPFELMKAAKDYQEEKDAKKLANEVSKLSKKKLEKEIDLMGTLSVNEVRNLYKDGFVQGSSMQNYSVDTATGNITSINDAEAMQFVTNLHETQLQSTFQSVIDTNSLPVPEIREVMKGLGKTTLDFITGGRTAMNRIPQFPTKEKPIIGKIYSMKIGDVGGYYLWGGDNDKSILIATN